MDNRRCQGDKLADKIGHQSMLTTVAQSWAPTRHQGTDSVLAGPTVSPAIYLELLKTWKEPLRVRSLLAKVEPKYRRKLSRG